MKAPLCACGCRRVVDRHRQTGYWNLYTLDQHCKGRAKAQITKQIRFAEKKELARCDGRWLGIYAATAGTPEFRSDQ